jgi:hypothetical protein
LQPDAFVKQPEMLAEAESANGSGEPNRNEG